ncbi:AAC(3) family N-acetyltransferase [Paenibacillus massiliensis]|uniref:aminoglycoside N(3)-acetyltransferase n=1 Tax=Paenibacillus massiliensis TaxID=225917 RepID=UPI00047034E9
MTHNMIIEQPLTQTELVRSLHNLGVREGMTLLVHTSLRSFGRYIPGDASTVITALRLALGPQGTLVMPTQSSDLTDPATWQAPPADPKWWNLIREEMPAYDPYLTVTNGMGRVAELFRLLPGVIRSMHPQLSFAAQGPLAEALLAEHSLDFALGEASPLARMYENDAYVLLLGCGHDSNTSLHLAEYRTNYAGKEEQELLAPVLQQGGKQWVKRRDINITSDDFDRLGADFEREYPGEARRVEIGQASCFLGRQRVLVDYAQAWLPVNRTL